MSESKQNDWLVTMIDVDECCSYVPIGRFASLKDLLAEFPDALHNSNLIVEELDEDE